MQSFHNFPKQRPQLSAEYEVILNKVYKQNRQRKTAASKLSLFAEHWHHERIARFTASGSCLEIGAGTLNHLYYRKANLPVTYDVVEPDKDFYDQTPDFIKSKVNKFYQGIEEIPQDKKYDNVISFLVLEHLCNLPVEIARSALLMSTKGTQYHAVPNEGYLAWSIGWRMTTGLDLFIKTGKNYGKLLRHEHVNTLDDIENVLKIIFQNVTTHRPIFWTKHLSLYTIFECSDPDIELCQYLSN